VIISVETGEQFPLITPDAALMGDFSPRFSPDGRRIAFTRVRRFATSEIHVLKLTPDLRPDDHPLRLDADEVWNAFPAWTPDSRHVVFASGLLHGARLKSEPADGRTPVTMPVAESAASPLDIRSAPNPEHCRIVYSRIVRDVNILRFPLEQTIRGPIAAALPIADSSFVDEAAQYAPDGKQIAYTSNRTGTFQVWTGLDGADARQATQFRSAAIHTIAWSPDSRRIAMEVMLPGEYGLYELNVSTGETRSIVQGPAYGPSYMPDGKHLFVWFQ
jgi:Tol biopolymer transport system component